MATSPENVGALPHVISEEEYYKLADGSDVRLEFIGGQVRAMAGASWNHVKLASRFATAINNRLEDDSCEATTSDLLVKVEATTDKFYPDVVVACEDARFDTSRPPALLTPIILVEVLSPSTTAIDFNEKLSAYRLIPTLRHYLIVEQRRVLVHHYRRLADEEWRIELYRWRREEISFEDLNVRFPLEEIYRRLDIAEGLVVLPLRFEAE